MKDSQKSTKDATASDVKAIVSGTTESVERHYKHGEPCELNCERHVTHPCERCGRIMAQGEAHFIEFE